MATLGWTKQFSQMSKLLALVGGLYQRFFSSKYHIIYQLNVALFMLGLFISFKCGHWDKDRIKDTQSIIHGSCTNPLNLRFHHHLEPFMDGDWIQPWWKSHLSDKSPIYNCRPLVVQGYLLNRIVYDTLTGAMVNVKWVSNYIVGFILDGFFSLWNVTFF